MAKNIEDIKTEQIKAELLKRYKMKEASANAMQMAIKILMNSLDTHGA